MRKSIRNKLIPLLSALMVFSCVVPVSASSATTKTTIKDNMGGTLVINNTKGTSNSGTSLLSKDKLAGIATKEGLGSITVTLSKGASGTSLEGVEFSCTKVADIDGGEYILSDAYSGTGVDLMGIETAKDMESAAKKLADAAGNDKISTTDSAGKLVYKNLEIGVYLLEATNTDKYDNVTPFLISIPTWDESKGDMMYDVTVIPKHEAKPGKSVTPGTAVGKGAPQTNVDSHIVEYFGGAVVVLILLVVVNKAFGKKRKVSK